MQSQILEKKGLKRKLELLIPSEEVEKSFSKSYHKIQKEANLPGFRKGKIPLKTLRQTHKTSIHKEVIDDLFKKFYHLALKDHQIRPVSSPILFDMNLKEGMKCKFIFELEVHPQVKVENYKNLNLKKIDVHVTEKEVDQTLEKLQHSLSTFKESPNQGPVKKGDYFTVHLEGFFADKKGKPINEPDFLIKAGENAVGPGFDHHLMGLKQGETRNFNFTFPKNHSHFKLAGQTLNMKVKLLSFKEKQIPDINEDLAKQFKLESLSGLREKIKKDLLINLKQKAREDMENSIVEQLVEKNPVELPEALVLEQKDRLKNNAKKHFTEYKMSTSEQEALLKQKDRVFEEEARKSLHISYLMEQLIQDLQIKNNKEDVKKSLQESFPKNSPEEMEKKLKQGGYWDNFIFNLTRKKLISYLIEQAKIS